MEYLFLTEDENGVSFFEDRAFELTPTNFAPPAPDVLLSDALAAERCVMLTLPVGWVVANIAPLTIKLLFAWQVAV